jgi:hypothetical protein
MKYRNIEIAREISISLSIDQKIFGNIVIVIDMEILNIAQPYLNGRLLPASFPVKIAPTNQLPRFFFTAIARMFCLLAAGSKLYGTISWFIFCSIHVPHYTDF